MVLSPEVPMGFLLRNGTSSYTVSPHVPYVFLHRSVSDLSLLLWFLHNIIVFLLPVLPGRLLWSSYSSETVRLPFLPDIHVGIPDLLHYVMSSKRHNLYFHPDCRYLLPKLHPQEILQVSVLHSVAHSFLHKQRSYCGVRLYFQFLMLPLHSHIRGSAHRYNQFLW